MGSLNLQPIARDQAEAEELRAKYEHSHGWPGDLGTSHERDCAGGCMWETEEQAQDRQGASRSDEPGWPR